MSNEPSNDSHGRFQESVTTHVYDACGNLTSIPRDARTVQLDWYGRRAEGAMPIADGPVMPHRPGLRHTFEFRLTGSETQEQCLPLSPAFPPAEFILATPNIRAYVTRTVEPAAASSAIGGVDVKAELRGTAIVCRASLTDFGPGDLVVVQVDVALERKSGGSS
jgi:hypothetical protein